MKTTAVYMDYDNVSISMADYYKVDATELIKKLREGIEKETNLRMIKAFCDFKHVKDEEIKGLDSLLVELRHVTSASANGKSNASDIALAIDVSKSLYNPISIDKYYIVSSDSDMFSLLKELKFFNKEIELVYLEKNIGSHYKESLASSGISSQSIEELIGVDVYQDFNMEEIESELDEILYVIYEKILEIKTEHGERGSVSSKAIMEALTSKYSFNDSKQLITYLENEKYLIIGKIGKYNDYRISDKGRVILGDEIEEAETIFETKDVDNGLQFSVEDNLEELIQEVNQLITGTFERYKGKGTVGNKLLFEYLGEKYGVDNTKPIVIYLTSNGYLEIAKNKSGFNFYVVSEKSLCFLKDATVIKKKS